MRKTINTYKTRVILKGFQKQEQDKPRKSFRISAKRMFLTFSQVDPDMSPPCLLELLEKKLHLARFDYVIAKEMHNDGNVHYHVVLINNTKFEIKDQHFLDLEFNGQTYHGNYQSVRFLTPTIEYACKDKQYITNIKNLQEGKLLDDKDFVLQRARRVGFKQALVEYSERFPKKAFSASSVSALRRNFKDIQQIQDSLQDDIIESPFTMENFNLQGRLREWAENSKWFKYKTLVLVGQSGIGKTQFARTFCIKNKWKTLLVNHKEDFHRINTSYDAVIIDDANFLDFNDTQKLALLDNSASKTIRVLYQTVRKKQGVVMIILMNHAQHKHIYKLFKQRAFARRIVLCEPKQPFMINVNPNQIDHIYNGDVNHINHITFEEHVKEEEQLIKDNLNSNINIYQNKEF